MIRTLSTGCALLIATGVSVTSLSAATAPLTPEMAERVVLASTPAEIAGIAMEAPALAATAICEAASLGIATPAEVVRAGQATAASADGLRELARAAAECGTIPAEVVAALGGITPAALPVVPSAEDALALLEATAASGTSPALRSQTDVESTNCAFFRVKRQQSAETVPKEQWTPDVTQLFPFAVDDSRLLPEFQVAHDWRRDCLAEFGVEIGEAGTGTTDDQEESNQSEGEQQEAAAPPEDEIETGFPGSQTGVQPIQLTNSPPPFVELPSEAQNNPSPS